MSELVKPRFTTRQRQALYYEGAPWGVFFLVDHPDELVRVWSGFGNVVIDGNTWIGGGNAIGVTRTPIDRELSTKVISLVFALNHDNHERQAVRESTDEDLVDGNDVIGSISRDIRNRRAEIFLGIFNEQNHVIDGLIPYNIINLEYSTTSTSLTQDLYIMHGIENGAQFVDAKDTLATQEYQDIRIQRLIAEGRLPEGTVDTGFSEMPSLQKRKVAWTPGSRRAGGV